MFSFRNSKLPLNRELRSSLQTVRGVGGFISFIVALKFGFSYPFFFGNMNFYQFLLLTYLLKNLVGRFNHIERFNTARIQMLIKLGTFRGYGIVIFYLCVVSVHVLMQVFVKFIVFLCVGFNFLFYFFVFIYGLL